METNNKFRVLHLMFKHSFEASEALHQLENICLSFYALNYQCLR
jgi:hypothetical protein